MDFTILLPTQIDLRHLRTKIGEHTAQVLALAEQ